MASLDINTKIIYNQLYMHMDDINICNIWLKYCQVITGHIVEPALRAPQK